MTCYITSRDSASWLACLPTEMSHLLNIMLSAWTLFSLSPSPSFCVCVRQLRIVSSRTMWNGLRNPQTSIGQLSLGIFFAILMGTIFYQIPMVMPEALQNRYNSAGITCSSALFVGTEQLLCPSLHPPLVCFFLSGCHGNGMPKKELTLWEKLVYNVKVLHCGFEIPHTVSVSTTGPGRSSSSLSTWSFRTCQPLNCLSRIGRSSCESKIRLNNVRARRQMIR